MNSKDFRWWISPVFHKRSVSLTSGCIGIRQDYLGIMFNDTFDDDFIINFILSNISWYCSDNCILPLPYTCRWQLPLPYTCRWHTLRPYVHPLGKVPETKTLDIERSFLAEFCTFAYIFSVKSSTFLTNNFKFKFFKRHFSAIIHNGSTK